MSADSGQAPDDSTLVGRATQFLKFVGVGALATILQYCMLIGCVELLHMQPVVGSSLGFGLSALLNYYLNYRYTFGSSVPHRVAVMRFGLVSSAGLLLNAGAMSLLTARERVPYMLAQVFATALVLIWNYTGSALWSFSAVNHPGDNAGNGGPV
jgi:putative flippase GtrA